VPTVEEKLRRIIAEQMGMNPAEIRPDAAFDDLGLDSLDRVNLTMALEEAFDVHISDQEAEKLTTLQDLVDYIHKHAKSVKQ
jgi:acyl carrier protein